MNYLKSRTADLRERKPIIPEKWKTKNTIPVKKRKEINGKSVTYMALEEQDQAEIMKNYKPEDFSIENLQEINAIASMTEGQITPSTLQTISYLEGKATHELDKLDTEEWAKKYIAETKRKNEKQTSEEGEQK